MPPLFELPPHHTVATFKNFCAQMTLIPITRLFDALACYLGKRML